MVVGGISLATAPTASAAPCPSIDPTTHAVTPALPGSRSEWAGCDLSGANLASAALFGYDFTGANFTGATLTSAGLSGAILTNANLSSAIMTRAGLSGATMTNANLSGATMNNATMNSVTLTNANLSGATMTSATMNSATLTNANLSGAIMTSATFNGANLTNVNLTNVNLTSATLNGSNLTNVNLTNVNLTSASMWGVNFSSSFVNCGSSAVLGTTITSIPNNLPSGWTIVSGTLTAVVVACPIPAAPAPAAPPPPPPPAPESLPPVAGVAPAAEVPPGASSGSVNGVPVTTTVTVNPAGGVQVSGGGSTVALADVGPDGLPLPATGGGLAGAPGGGLSVSASGFLPQSQADVYMYSEQLWLGKATVDAAGTVSMSLTIPSWVTPGGHTLQFVGYQGPYTSIALSTGITVAAPVAQVISGQPAAREFTARFRRSSADLAPTARAGIRSVVSAAAKARAGATVACTAIHLEPVTAQARTLWVSREAAVNVFLSNAGCDTVTIGQGTVAVASGQPGLAIRIAAVAG
ncbi:MAG: pentapeptide repeat-containing protein [Candidatus Nanopelagicales bacterium]